MSTVPYINRTDLIPWYVKFLRGFQQSAAAFLMSFFPGSSGMTIMTDEDETREVFPVVIGDMCLYRVSWRFATGCRELGHFRLFWSFFLCFWLFRSFWFSFWSFWSFDHFDRLYLSDPFWSVWSFWPLFFSFFNFLVVSVSCFYPSDPVLTGLVFVFAPFFSSFSFLFSILSSMFF